MLVAGPEDPGGKGIAFRKVVVCAATSKGKNNANCRIRFFNIHMKIIQLQTTDVRQIICNISPNPGYPLPVRRSLQTTPNLSFLKYKPTSTDVL